MKCKYVLELQWPYWHVRVVNLLASPQGEPGLIPGRVTGFSLVGGFSRVSPVSSAPSFRLCSIFTSITLIGSQDLAVKSCPNLFTLNSRQLQSHHWQTLGNLADSFGNKLDSTILCALESQVVEDTEVAYPHADLTNHCTYRDPHVKSPAYEHELIASQGEPLTPTGREIMQGDMHIATERDWAAMASDQGHDYLPNRRGREEGTVVAEDALTVMNCDFGYIFVLIANIHPATARHLIRGRGSAVARELASHQGELGSIPGRVGVVLDDTTARWIFSGSSRFPLPGIPALLHTHLASLLSALKTSILRAAQILSLHSTSNLVAVLF
ncbi:hypothetical protein PR048_024315 [Dryococelus australis]|uniref:Uncharacterized protein n=1 Tax=Dryococelus australis TaxID=614101 RepID=A0ABQ9GN90_9NEOP|nr:hypothetical protein PR048_024315 [Dryococelus australis]